MLTFANLIIGRVDHEQNLRKSYKNHGHSSSQTSFCRRFTTDSRAAHTRQVLQGRALDLAPASKKMSRLIVHIVHIMETSVEWFVIADPTIESLLTFLTRCRKLSGRGRVAPSGIIPKDKTLGKRPPNTSMLKTLRVPSIAVFSAIIARWSVVIWVGVQKSLPRNNWNNTNWQTQLRLRK